MCSCDVPDAVYGYHPDRTLIENLGFGPKVLPSHGLCECPDSYLLALGSLEGWLVPAVAAGIVAGVVLSNRAKSVWKPFVAWLAVMVIVFFKDYLRHNEYWKAGREIGVDAAELNEIIADYFLIYMPVQVFFDAIVTFVIPAILTIMAVKLSNLSLKLDSSYSARRGSNLED